MKIAILGSTSHIAKGLIVNYLKEAKHELVLFARWAERAKAFIHSVGGLEQGKYDIIQGYDSFHNLDCDAIINCVGVHERNRKGLDYTKYFAVTELFDNMVISYLGNHPDTRYISMSSGVVSYSDFYITPDNYYAIVRLNAEAKHRAHRNLYIIDIRIFNYFSRYADTQDGLFISDIIEAIRNDHELTVDSREIARDYIHPSDLYGLVNTCIDSKINTFVEAYSKESTFKTEILKYFVAQYGLKYKYGDPLKRSATGTKSDYTPTDFTTNLIGYYPKYTSLDTIKEESAHILGGSHA